MKLRTFAGPYYSSEPLLPWQHFSSIYLDQQFPEAQAQRDLTASQVSMPQCMCSDYDLSVTDHPVFVCTAETICVCTVNPVHPECIWLVTHTLVACAACVEVLTHPKYIRFIVRARFFVCIYFCLENIWAERVSRMCNGKAILRDFYQLKYNKSLLRVHRVGNLNIIEYLFCKTWRLLNFFKRNILSGGRGRGE